MNVHLNWMLSLRFFLLYLLLGLSTAFVGSAKSQQFENSFYSKAQQAAASNQWAVAEDLYKKAKTEAIQQDDTEQTLDILFSLLYIYQQQFDGIAAFQTAAEIEELAVVLTDPFSLTRSYRLLGIAYQALANNDLARDYFSVAVDSARGLNRPLMLASLINELGYADVLVSDYTSAIASFQESFTLARSINDQDLMLQAQINLLRARIVLGDKAKIKQKFSILESLLNEIPESVNLISSIISVGTLYRSAQIKLNLPHKHRKTAYLHYEHALNLAKKYQDNQLQSIANGYIGQLYSDEAQYNIAATYTQEAIVLAQKLNNLDLQFRWSVQLGRIYVALNKTGQALSQYKRAIESLDSLDIVSFMRFERSFNADVKPVFDELFLLLFQIIHAETDEVKQQFLLIETIEYIEKLRKKELLAFCFGNCKQKVIDKNGDIPLGDMPLDSVILYPIALKNQLYVVMKTHSSIYYKKHNIPREKIINNLNKFNEHIQQNDAKKSYLKQAKLFYQWLIQPYEKVLAQEKIQTIAFMPSQAFMQLPYDALFSEDQFLAENYVTKQILSYKNLKNPTKVTLENPSYQLKSSSDKEDIWAPGKQAPFILYAENNLSQLKENIGDIKKHSILVLSTNLLLANDYRQSMLVLPNKNIPLFDLLSKTDNKNSLGLIINTTHNVGNLNNVYFNAHLTNADSVILPLWTYPVAAKQPLISAFQQSLIAGNSIEKALRSAKLALIKNKTLQHPINWAGLSLYQ